MSRGKHKPASSDSPSAKPRPLRNAADRLILENAKQILPSNVLLILTKGTRLAPELVQQHPQLQWNIFTFEHFLLTSVVQALSESHNADAELFCMPDLPDAQFDTVILPTDSRSSSELTRDLLQSVRQRLKPEGRLITSTNNPRDHWLHEQLKADFGRTTVIKDKQGVCYVARKGHGSGKIRNFDCEFAFRDQQRLIHCASRPGVFSHRRLDMGARALTRSLELIEQDPIFQNSPPQKVVEMGCGCGAAAVAAALRYPRAEILAVDSHARAVQSTERTAALNDVHNVNVLLTSDGNVPGSEEWDVFLCNPPYYSDFQISELFLQSAMESLCPGGRIHLVTKLTDWHENRMIEVFANAETHQYGDYHVIVSQV